MRTYCSNSCSCHRSASDKSRVCNFGTREQEEKTGEKAAAATRVDLYGMIPPIEKMEPALNALVKCEYVTSTQRFPFDHTDQFRGPAAVIGLVCLYVCVSVSGQ